MTQLLYWISTLLLGVVLSTSVEGHDGSFINENINRKINLATSHGLENSLTFQVTRKDTSAKFYLIPLRNEADAGPIAYHTCTVNNDVVKDVQLDKSAANTVLKVGLPEGFNSGTIACSVIRVGRKARRPYPAEILQLEKQRFLFESETIRVPSPYALQGDENTEVVLPRGRVDLLSNDQSVVVQGNRVLCGPFKQAASENDLNNFVRVQYDASIPIPLATYVEREIELSHWGNIAVEEHFDLYNDGAKLKGEFSRLDHQGHNVPHAFQNLLATLPAEAYGVYYRDELGNVTTSNMWKPKNKKATQLALKLRFPLYGGWHIEWYHGYNVPLTTFVTKVQGVADRYLLDCDLAHPIEVLAEKLVLHIVLPPGATNVKIESPVKSRIVKEETFRRYTYLDVPWTARNVLSLELHNVIGGELKGFDNRLRIYYSYSNVHIMEKPLTVSATLFAVLVAFMAWGRISN